MLMLGSDGIRRSHRPPENHATFLLPNLRESRLPWIHEAAHAGPPRLPPPVRLHGWMGSTPSTHPSEKKLPRGSSSVLGAWMQRYPLRSVGDIVGLSPRCSAHTRGRARLRWTGGAWETPRACSHGVATGGASHVAREIRNGRVRRTRTWWRLTTTNDRTTRCLLKPRGMRGHARTRREVVTTCDGKGGVRATTLAESPTVSEEGLGSAKSVSAVILGGGAGTRLYPLTKSRAKPAVPIGGAYRLIDVPMSNCINSGIKKIYILTQFNSTSLNRHLARTYNFGSGIRVGGAGFVEVLAATQTPESTPGGKDWFRGTADAVRQYSWLFTDIKNKDIEDVLILSGDHLYRMDYMDFVRKHRESGAGITVGCLPVDHSRASDFGLMKIDDTGRIIEFAEKPKGDALEAMKVDTAVLGLSREEANLSPFIASMGIYVFKKSVLLDLLMKDFPLALDFGSEILPAASKSHKVQAYLFNDYWEDIGTIKSFFDANLALTQQPPRFEFYDPDNPIYTSPRFLPPAKIKKSHVVDSIISHGCFLQECSVEHSIIGLRSRVEKGADIKDTMLIGADFYESKEQRDSLLAAGKVPIGVGQNCVLRNCIADKNARIGRDCVIVNKDGIEEANREDEGLYIRSGIVTVLRNATVHPGTVI